MSIYLLFTIVCLVLIVTNVHTHILESTLKPSHNDLGLRENAWKFNWYKLQWELRDANSPLVDATHSISRGSVLQTPALVQMMVLGPVRECPLSHW